MFIRSGYSAQTRKARAGGSPSPALRSGTQHHDGAAGVLLGGRDVARGRRGEAQRARLSSQLRRAQTVELDDASLAPDAAGARGRSPRDVVAGGHLDLALALDHDAAGANG